MKKVKLSEEDKRLADSILKAAKKAEAEDDFPADTDDEILLLRLD